MGIPTLANSLKNIGQEYAERMLSPRENLRVGSALILAAEGIHKRLENENPVRMVFSIKIIREDRTLTRYWKIWY